jgi:hypothetical protein
MPNAAQIATYNFIRSEINRLRGPQSHAPLSLDQVTPLADDGNYAVFRVNGAHVFVKPSGKVHDTGLPDCPTYANRLLSGRFLPAIAADLLSRGNPHKSFLHSQKHTPESFVAYLQHGTVLDKNRRDIPQRSLQGKVRVTSACADKLSKNADPYNFVLQFQPSEIDDLVSRRLTNVDQDKAFQAGSNIASGNYGRDNLNVIVAWKMEGVHLTRVMSYLDQNTDTDLHHALRSAIEADTERSAIEILDRLHGVGVPVASAILTTVNPEKYTIIDIYALKSLGVTDGPTNKVDYYLAYLRKCRQLAQQFQIALRTLDHALWQWGYEHRR